MKFKRNAKKSPREGKPPVRELPLITPCSIDNYTRHTHFCHSGGGTEVRDQGSMTPSFQLSTNPFWPPLLACLRMHQNTPFRDRKIPNSITPHWWILGPSILHLAHTLKYRLHSADPDIYMSPFTGKSEQQRFTIRSGILTSISSSQRSAVSDRPLRERTDFWPAGSSSQYWDISCIIATSIARYLSNSRATLMPKIHYTRFPITSL